MHPMSILGHVAEALAEYRKGNRTAEHNMALFFKDRKYLGSTDRREVGDIYFHLIRHIIRFDESIRISLENAPWIEWITRSLGFPASDPTALAVWSKDVPPPMRPYPMDRWFDMFRACLAACDVDREYIHEVREKFVLDWPKSESWHQGEWVERLMTRALEQSRIFKAGGRSIAPEFKYSLPAYYFSLLGSGLKPKELPEFYESLNHPAPVGLRVNSLQTSREDYLKKLDEAEMGGMPADLVPNGIIMEGRIARGKLPDFEEGHIEFQDIASQLLVESLPIKSGEVVLDACAGGGGKALQLAIAVGESGQVLVHDAVPGRLINTFERASRAGASWISSLQPINDDLASNVAKPESPWANAKRQIVREVEDNWEVWPDWPDDKPTPDWVIIDAPCSGSGTIRRQPELRFRITKDSLLENIRIQRGILKHWSGCVPPGGKLVWMTCSFFREENELIITEFLEKNPEFILEKFDRHDFPDKKFVTREGFIRTWPHRHDGDGFFMAVMKKKNM